MFCAKCGKELPKEARYCSNCGVVVSVASETPKATDLKPTITYSEFLKRKEQNRREHFSLYPKKAKKSGKDLNLEKEVSICIGIKKYEPGFLELKYVRGKSLPIRVLPSDGPKTILEKAVTKHEHHNTNWMVKGQRYVLLYPDDTEVVNLPGSNKPFILHDYKEEVGKSYSRLTLYIALYSDFVFTSINTDHDDVSLLSGDETSTEKSVMSMCHSDDDDDIKSLLTPVFARTSPETPSLKPANATSTCTSTSASMSYEKKVESSDPEVDESKIKDQKQEKRTQRLVECPTCFKSFPLADIGIHADICSDIWIGDAPPEYSSTDDEQIEAKVQNSNDKTTEKIEDIKLVISDLASKFLISNEQVRINIRRKNLWADFKEARQKRNLTPNDKIRVVFMGEPAIDDGGPKREFFSGNIFF